MGRGYEQLGALDALHQLPGGQDQLGHLGACRRRLQAGRGRGCGRCQDIGQRRGAEGMWGAAAAGIIRLLLLLGGAGPGVLAGSPGVVARAAAAVAAAALGRFALAAIKGGRGGCGASSSNSNSNSRARPCSWYCWCSCGRWVAAHAEIQRRIEHGGS